MIYYLINKLKMGNFNEKENGDIYDDIFNEKKYFDIEKEIENNICCCFKNQRNYLEKVEIKDIMNFQSIILLIK